MNSVDVLVIGAGPGGYPAAIRAAQLGKSVIIVDKGTIGGECLNWGCIPSKALISASDLYHKISHKSEIMGIHVSSQSIDIQKMQTWKQSIQNKMIDGINALLKSHKVKIVFGTASFIKSNEVEVVHNDGNKETIKCKDVIIATGSTFISLPGFEIDEKIILSAKGVLELEEVPNHLICVGGGIIGLELGTVWAKLGAKVTIVELMPQLMTGVDKRLVNVVEKRLKTLGVEIYKEAKAKAVKIGKKENLLEIETKSGIIEAKFDKILLSIGKKATTDKLGLSKIGVKTDKGGYIMTDKFQKTNINGIYAIGDCTGVPFLAHKATKQGIIAAEVIAGLPSEYDFKAVPSAIFTDPEIATAGMTESIAKELGYQTHVGMASFAASGRSLTQLESEGFVKIITDAKDGVVLGVEMVGPHVSDLISEAALALEMGATAEDLGFTMHPHPTLPEMLMEAAESSEGKAIHVANRRKK
ncbi:MAG: dihydrolipoyl dehydrogenase [Candidatus Heimdallarchaeota archaeon]|nr:dihydrolipoyl dehydrogenase [Candidatus Heimdallarchaeota archaeon]